MTSPEIDALRLSLWVAVWAVAGSLPLGILCAWLLARRRFPGRGLLDMAVHLPLVLPPVVVGYGLLILFGRNGTVGGWMDRALGIDITFTWKGAAVASAVMAFPLMVRALRLSIEAVDRGLEEAAATLGAPPLAVFFTVTLPLAAPGVLGGVVLAFARSLGEFGATITFVSNIPGETRTLPLALYTLLDAPGGEAAASRLCLVSLAVAAVALLASELLSRRLRRRLEA